MEPSTVNLLEEDQDESMHSGAAVEALQAGLNRHMEGDVSTSQSSDSDNVCPEGINQSSSQSVAQWQILSEVDNNDLQTRQRSERVQQKELEQTQHLPHSNSQQLQPMDASKGFTPLPHLKIPPQANCQQEETGQVPSYLPQTTGIKAPETNSVSGSGHQMDRPSSQDTELQYTKLQKIRYQDASGKEPSSTSVNRGKQVSFAALLPALMLQLDKDRALQLQTLYRKLQKNEIAKDVFVCHMKDIVGDQMLRLEVIKLQAQSSSQGSAQQNHPRMPTATSAQLTGAHSFSQLHHKSFVSPVDNAHAPSPAVPVQVDSSYQLTKKSAQKSGDMECHSDSSGVTGAQLPSSSSGAVKQERDLSSIPLQVPNKPHQQLQFPQPSFPMYGSTSYHPYSGPNITVSGSTLKPQSHGSQIRSITQQLSMGSAPLGGFSQANLISGSKLDRQNSFNDTNRVHGGSLPHFPSNSTSQQNSVPRQASTGSSPLSLMSYVKPEQLNQHTGQQHRFHFSTPQRLASGQMEQRNTTPTTSKVEASEEQSSRIGLMIPTNIVPATPVSSILKQLDSTSTLSSRLPSDPSLVGISIRTPPKKSYIGQKKPVEALGSSPPQPSKKQKVSGAISDQRIEQLNDVTAVSGVNLQEEEEQLFSGSKEDNRVSEASRKVVREEEERLLLQRTPLQKKMAEIMSKCGLKNISNDVERCLSLCVEERMRGLICHLIRLSKQRVDVEKPRHRTLITSDVKQQIMAINQKTREEWERKQAEVEILRKLNEPEDENAIDVGNEKGEGCAKSIKANKDDDDKLRATAANVAARAALGGDDMLSKWQLVAEQARQKCEGGLIDESSGSQLGKDGNCRALPMDARNSKDNDQTERRCPASPLAAGTIRNCGRNQIVIPQTQFAITISIKDVIATLEQEPQMSKSTLIYQLYDKIRCEAGAKSWDA